jgi:CHAT domain-containing protein
MYMHVRMMVVLVSVAGLASCQTAKQSMSVEEAKTLKAEFKVSSFKNLPRHTADLRDEFKNGGPIPNNCVAIRKARNDKIKGLAASLKNISRKESWGWVKSLSVGVEDSLISGRFDEALNYIAVGMTHSFESQIAERLRSQRVRILAQIGDVEQAATEMDRFSIFEWESGSSTAKIFQNSGLAAVAHFQGDLPLAERFYRDAIYNASFSTSSNDYVNINALRAGLVQTLLQQGRLIEAEAAARESIKKMGIGLRARRAQRKVYETSYYSGGNAGPVAMLAAVFLDQGRLDDATYLARIAVNMHDVGCSDPESLGLNRARSTLISVLAQQGNWPAVLKQIGVARDALSAFPELFDRIYGSSLDFAEAQIYAGDAEDGRRILNNKMADTVSSKYEVAIVRGLVALAEIQGGNRNAALKLFAGALPELTSGDNGNENGAVSKSRNGRKGRILTGYMSTLNSLVDEGKFRISGTDIPAEIMRIASVTRLGRVQQAFAASHVRAASGDPDLSALVRQEQDLAHEVRTTSETLAYLRFSPEIAAKSTSSEKLSKRLLALNSARRALKSEILKRFPSFSEFTNPRPMTVDDISNSLKPHQAMLAYHVTETKIYIWAVNKRGSLTFSTQNVGRQQLTEMVNKIRQAVDPGPLETLNDVPEFDVGLSHDLYNLLLNPVRKGWEEASEILVVPHGPLGSLPFSMLALSPDVDNRDGTNLFDRYKGVSWLVKETAITQLPSIIALKRNVRSVPAVPAGSKGQPAVRKPFFGIGDPYFSRKQHQVATAKTIEVATRGLPFRTTPKTRNVDKADLTLLPRLPATRDEILSIADALGADKNKDVLLGERATEAMVKSSDLSSYKVISFATHGLVPGDLNGLDQPALALTNPDVVNGAGDGLLSMTEILSLQLDADIAVLSACNTAAADGKGAEAISGLGRAFFYAGARSILVSNWPVHSKATTDLMSKLFGTLSADNTLSRSEALRRSKLSQIADGGFSENGTQVFSYAHPIFWAPFSLVGDSG